MLTRKEIAALVDVSPWTVKRWMKKFGIRPDQRGHGPDKYKHTTATRFVKLFDDFYNQLGSTPQLVRAKYRGDLFDARQLDFFILKKSK